MSNLTAAKILLYRASDFARADAEHKIVRSKISQISALSPWKFSAGVNITPSTNINGGSRHDTIQHGGLEFELDEDAKAQSGVRYSASAELSHRTRLSSTAIWEQQISAVGNAYDGRGRNEVRYTLKSGLRYTPKNAIPSLFYGFLSYGKRYIAQTVSEPILDEYIPYNSQLTYGLEYHRQPKPTSAWKVFTNYSNRISNSSTAKDAQIGTIGGSYTFALNDDTALSISGFAQDTRAVSPDVAASAGNLSTSITWKPDTLPFALSGNIGYMHTEFKHLAGGYSVLRIDDNVSLKLAFTHHDIQFYGFNPTIGVNMSRNSSNLNRFDTETLQVFTRLSTSF